MSSSGSCDYAVPSTCRAGVEAAASAGNNARDATGFKQEEKREDISTVVYGDVNHAKKLSGERRSHVRNL
ncbi:hypothetical protein MTO96_024387 [Rhipicephalus appendiculatus]